MSARVLFVDDETRVLDGLRRTLFAQRVDWKCDFANDGIAALQLIDRTPYDAVVADMNMAPMDGTELLCQVRDRRPATLRFVLSGHIGTEMAVRALSVAQQLLSKPCDTRALVDAIESGVAVQRRLSDPLIRTMIGRLKALPAAPRVYSQITAALLHPLCDARRIASILARDPGLAANVLHLANSAFFNTGGRSAADLGQAVARVGLATIADLVLATEVFDASANGAAADRLRNRSLFASRLAARIAAGRSDAGLAATAALLCDIGYMLPGVSSIDIGERSFSAHAHAEIGASLLALWALPLPIVEAVACHHAPSLLPLSEFGLHGIVHVASALANEYEPDLDFLAARGVEDRLPQWRAMANERPAHG